MLPVLVRSSKGTALARLAGVRYDTLVLLLAAFSISFMSRLLPKTCN